MKPIAHVRTCYEEKFGVPRQPGLVDEAWGELVFDPEFRNLDAVRGLEGFSHIWLIFIFHQSIRDKWKPTVRPPRLGGNEKIGVFASRSPFRPNPIGLSCVRLESIEFNHPEAPVLKLRGVDLVDGTPIVDIKPYLPYSDSIPDADGGFASNTPEKLKIDWADQVGGDITESAKALIEKTLACDPRPAYQQTEDKREYGCLIDRYNVRWRAEENTLLITSCKAV